MILKYMILNLKTNVFIYFKFEVMHNVVSTKRVDESKRVVNACKRVKTSGKRVETTGKRMETIDMQ